jgi:hypothetical protein
VAEPTINDTMSALAQDAVDFANRNFGVVLDFSNASVEQVETIAEELYQSIPQGMLNKLFHLSPSEGEIQKICDMFGAYIGEVFRRGKGGVWANNQEFSAVGIQHGASWLFPQGKVHDRLRNGSEDNLWTYFRALLEG